MLTYVNNIHHIYRLITGQIGFGFLMGYTSGFCLKKLSKVFAVVIGGFYISLQFLAYDGYVSLNVDKIEKDFNKAWDLNKDGKVDIEDAKIFYDTVSIYILLLFIIVL